MAFRTLFCSGLVLLLFPLYVVQSATLYLSPSQSELNRGDTLKLSIRLDVDEAECVNTVDGIVNYSDNIEPVDISRGTSIFSMWVEDPVINREERTITFAGGIPNGYCGRIIGDPRLTNTVLDLLFQSPGFVIGGSGSGTASDTATVSFDPRTQILLNDGYGTVAPAQLYGAEVVLNPKAGREIKNDWLDIVSEDTQPPKAFTINLERTKNAFSNDYFITFNTSDKQTGIDYYEVIEESDVKSFFDWGREDAPWVEARSPYVLKDQSLRSIIRVRALDKAGNEYVATLAPDKALQSVPVLENPFLLAIMGGVTALFVLSLGLFFWFTRRKKPPVTDDELVDDDASYEI